MMILLYTTASLETQGKTLYIVLLLINYSLLVCVNYHPYMNWHIAITVAKVVCANKGAMFK